jgi:nucleoside-diphosphate-sugar epimerase
MNYLITGTSSGIGRFLTRELRPTDTIDRTTNDETLSRIYDSSYDVIIHCAFNSALPSTISSHNGHRYIDDNVFMVSRLLAIPHQLFIFFSTDRIYPENSDLHREDDEILFEGISDIYSSSKLLSEMSVVEKAKTHLILRCVTLLGLDARENNAIRLLRQRPCKLSLTKDSSFNFVLHTDIIKFIRLAIEQDIRGIFNVSSIQDINLEKMIKAFLNRPKVEFGLHHYFPRKMSRRKIGGVTDVFEKTSEQVWDEFKRSL